MTAIDQAKNRPAEEPSQDKDTSSSALLSRRSLLKILGVAGVAGVVGGGVEHVNRLRADVHRRCGDFDNPRFQVKEDLLLPVSLTFRSHMQIQMKTGDIQENVEKTFLKAIEDMHNRLAKAKALREASALINGDEPSLGSESDAGVFRDQIAKDILASSPSDADLAYKSEIDNLLVRHAKVSDKIMDIDMTLSNAREVVDNVENGTILSQFEVENGLSNDLERTYGTPQSYVKNHIKRLTGDDFPDDISFEIRPTLERDALGFADFINQQIVSVDSHYAHVVLVLAHEAGHIMALHRETEMLYGRTFPPPYNSSDWEEACAYAFETVVEEAMASTPLSVAVQIGNRYRSQFLEQFYDGVHADECHRVGMAYFDAALTVLGSSAKAYNFLSTHRELTPEMKTVIEENRVLRAQSRMVSQGEAPRLNNVRDKLQELGVMLNDASR